MKRLLILLLTSLIVVTSCGSGAERKEREPQTYSLVYGGPTEELKHDWNLFYPSYYLYISMIMKLELDNFIDKQELKAILKTSIKMLSLSRAVQLTVPDYRGGKDLEITITPTRLKGNEKYVTIIFLTNYNAKTKSIIEKGDDMKYAFAQLFVVYDNKWVKVTNEYSEEKESELKGEDNLNNLADFYLLDERSDNDSEIEGLLLKDIAENEDELTRCVASFTLAEYYVMQKEFNKAAEQIEKATALLEALDAGKKAKISILKRVNRELLEFTEFISRDEEFWQAEFEDLNI